MTNPSGEIARPSRREQRLTSFLAPQLQANEQIEFILSLARENVWEEPPFPFRFGPTFAVVVTNHSVFIISLRRLSARPQTTGTATSPRESVTAEWTRDAYFVGGGYGGFWVGRLSVTTEWTRDAYFGTRYLWVEGKRRKARAQAIAAALNTGGT